MSETVAALKKACKNDRSYAIMEVCGTHTVSLFRSGVKSLLPANVRLISGPGCPVCVTSQGYIDTALELAQRKEVIIATYGDMLRVPGKNSSLERLKSKGANVVVCYSVRDALRIAKEQPEKEVVFLAVGFETTTPPTAAAILEAEARKIANFSILSGHKLVIPAMNTLLQEGDVPIDGFLCPGHVSIIIGADAYIPIAEKYQKPCVIAGFEPENMLQALLHIVRQTNAIRKQEQKAQVENLYSVAVSAEGNQRANELINKVFSPNDSVWRAMGIIPQSGLDLRAKYEHRDARKRFNVTFGPDHHPKGCRCGEVIQGKIAPIECKLFANPCDPFDPIGPCMVSSEGTCSAWYKYHRR